MPEPTDTSTERDHAAPRRKAADDTTPPSRSRLLRVLARELAANKGEVSDTTWQGALDAGWDEAAILDAYSEVIRTTLTNWFNHLVHTDQDLPEAPSLD